MNIDQWFHQLKLAYNLKEIKLSPEKKAYLLSEFPENSTYEQKNIVTEALEVMHDSFFRKAARGETFGQLGRIKERFGNTIEENYGLSSGPFINMAKTYWSYKIEVGDLYPEYYNLVLSKILKEIEMNIASVFFPTPGPAEIPVSQRRKKQRQLLQEFAPDIDIERFLSESPILGAKSNRVSRRKRLLLSKELQSYCYDRIYELAVEYNATLSSRLEYEIGFDEVMDSLAVPLAERENILLKTKNIAEASGISYYKLSPINQFLKTVVPYVYYCLENRPPANVNPEEINRLKDNEEFFHYLIRLGMKVSQKVKGALWRPGTGCIGKAVLILFVYIVVSFGFYLFYKLLF